MRLSISGLFRGRRTTQRRTTRQETYFRPSLESLEGRIVMSAPALINPPTLAPAIAPAATTPNINISGIQLNSFQVVNNVLQASGNVTGTLAGMPFNTQITNFSLQPDPKTCSILNLELAPIHVQLLGLHVDTSPICLTITGTPNEGVLGQLLCSLAGGGTGVPTLPTTTQISDLVTNLTSVLNQTLNNTPATPSSSHSVCTGQCPVLDLKLGPLNLSLLGLNVHLDNCSNGPVEICVSATKSEGLLGNLLCGLSGQRLLNLSWADITQLGSTATALLSDGTLSGQDVATLVSLVEQLVRV